MLGVFKGLQGSVPLHRKLRDPTTEGVANRLHFRATVVFLLGCSALVTCLEWVGNGKRISCVMEGEQASLFVCLGARIYFCSLSFCLIGKEDDWVIASNVINTYCFVLTTFTLPKHWNSKLGEEAAQPGVGAFNPYKDEVERGFYY